MMASWEEVQKMSQHIGQERDVSVQAPATAEVRVQAAFDKHSREGFLDFRQF